MNIAPSSSAVVAASSNPNDAEIRELKAKREFIEQLLGLEEIDRKQFCLDSPLYKGLKAYKTDEELMDEKKSVSAEILSLRTSSSGKYPHCYCHFSLYFNSYISICF
jgi:hypothetical protein